MSRRDLPSRSVAHAPAVLGLALCGLLACSQEMRDQPRYEPLEPSALFVDGRSSRHAVPGTVARGELRPEYLETGRLSEETFGAAYPFAIEASDLQRGRELQVTFCSPCHDRAGTGRGMAVQRGYWEPPSWHIERLREEAAGRLFHVVTHGYRKMPSYGPQIAPEDRWRIVAYLRALQLSQHAPRELLAPGDLRTLEGAP